MKMSMKTYWKLANLTSMCVANFVEEYGILPPRRKLFQSKIDYELDFLEFSEKAQKAYNLYIEVNKLAERYNHETNNELSYRYLKVQGTIGELHKFFTDALADVNEKRKVFC